MKRGGKRDNDLLTVQDLERLLLENGFVREADVAAVLQQHQKQQTLDYEKHGKTTKRQTSRGLLKGVGLPVSGPKKEASVAESQGTSDDKTDVESKGVVAFPQPSVLSYKSLKWGVTVSSTLTCTLLATSIIPSLWLMGGLVGSLYGYQTGKRLESSDEPTSFFPSFLLLFGRRLTKSYLQLYDMINAMFFMYKTGQLSYSMWRRYAEIDGRFRIQDKIDAWVSLLQTGCRQRRCILFH